MNETYNVSATIAAELLKTLKRDVPFETEKDILEAHARLTESLYAQSVRFLNQANGLGNNSTNTAQVSSAGQDTTPKTETKQAETKAMESSTEAPVKAGDTPQAPKKAAPTPTKAITTSEPAVLAMVQKAVDAVATKEGCEELKAKVLKATKLSLQDQSELIAKLDAKAKVLK